MALTLRSSSKSFSKELLCVDQLGGIDENPETDKPVQSWPEIYEKFKALRMLSYLINKSLGSIVCWFMADSILAYSLSLDAIFISTDFHKRISLLLNYFCAFGVLFVSADICKQVESLLLELMKFSLLL